MNYDKRLISHVRAFSYFFLLLRNDFLNLDIMARVANKIEDINSKHNRDTFVSCIFVTLLMLVVLKTMML